MKKCIFLIFFLIITNLIYANGSRQVFYNSDTFYGKIKEVIGDSRYAGCFTYLEHGLIEIKDKNGSSETFYCETYNENVKSDINDHSFIQIIFDPKEYIIEDHYIEIKSNRITAKLYFDKITDRLIEYSSKDFKSSGIYLHKYLYSNEGLLNAIVDSTYDSEMIKVKYYYDGKLRDDLKKPYLSEIRENNSRKAIYINQPSYLIYSENKLKYSVGIGKLSGDNAGAPIDYYEKYFYKRICEYDSFGNVIKYTDDKTDCLNTSSEEAVKSYKIDYIYDDYNNWIEASAYEIMSNGELKLECNHKRQIIYE